MNAVSGYPRMETLLGGSKWRVVWVSGGGDETKCSVYEYVDSKWVKRGTHSGPLRTGAQKIEAILKKRFKGKEYPRGTTVVYTPDEDPGSRQGMRSLGIPGTVQWAKMVMVEIGDERPQVSVVQHPESKLAEKYPQLKWLPPDAPVRVGGGDTKPVESLAVGECALVFFPETNKWDSVQRVYVPPTTVSVKLTAKARAYSADKARSLLARCFDKSSTMDDERENPFSRLLREFDVECVEQPAAPNGVVKE